jgi:hypothetical protein
MLPPPAVVVPPRRSEGVRRQKFHDLGPRAVDAGQKLRPPRMRPPILRLMFLQGVGVFDPGEVDLTGQQCREATADFHGGRSKPRRCA